MDCLGSISTSDRQDYYTFFHQHWSLFSLSFQSKLQAINYRLFVAEQPTKNGKNWSFQYTAVLARQSWLFNQFKYLCELRDTLESAGGHIQDGGLEMALWVASLLNAVHSDGSHLLKEYGFLPITTTVAKDRVQRWLHTLSVPDIPPCPIGDFVKETTVKKDLKKMRILKPKKVKEVKEKEVKTPKPRVKKETPSSTPTPVTKRIKKSSSAPTLS
jgi:hypothetical protein